MKHLFFPLDDMARNSSDAPLDPVDPLSRTLLSAAQRKLIASAIQGREIATAVTPEQRATIRELCEQTRLTGRHSEELLVAFKAGLSAAANELRVPVGPDRNDLIARLVSAFIQEFYGGKNSQDNGLSAADAKSTTRPKPDLEITPEARA